jgi:hypothetical protein
MSDYIFMAVVVAGGFVLAVYARWDYRRSIRRKRKNKHIRK